MRPAIPWFNSCFPSIPTGGLGHIQLEGLEAEPWARTRPLGLILSSTWRRKRIGWVVLFFSSHLISFESETVENLVSVFHEILRGGLSQPATPIAALELSHTLENLRGMGLLEMEKTDYPRRVQCRGCLPRAGTGLPGLHSRQQTQPRS